MTPYGIGLWGFVSSSAGLFRPYLSEWAPFNLWTHLGDHIDFVVLAVICLAALLRSREPKDPASILVLAVAFASACVLRRNIPLFALAAAVVLPRHLQAAYGVPVRAVVDRFPRGVWALPVAALLLMSAAWTVAGRSPIPHLIEVPRDRYPTRIVEQLRLDAVRGNLLTFFDWGEYSIWKLYPDCRVFMDGRLDCCYSRPAIEDYLRFFYGSTPEALDRALDAYPTDLVLVHVRDPVVKRMLERPGWSCVFAEPCAVLFARDAVHGNWIEGLRAKQPLPIVLTPGTGPVPFP